MRGMLMSQSLIKIIVFCTAFCSLPGSPSMASTLSSNYDSQSGNYDSQSADFDTEEPPDTPLGSDVLVATDVLAESEALLEAYAETEATAEHPARKYVYSNRQNVEVADIVVGRF